MHTSGVTARIVAESDKSASETKPAANKADVTWATAAETPAGPSVEKQKLVALVQSRQASNDDDSEPPAPRCVKCCSQLRPAQAA